MATESNAPQPTQVADPWTAVRRTMLAVLAVAAPILLIVADILREFATTYADIVPGGVITWALSTAALLTVTAGFVTRVMNIPAVNELLKKVKLGAKAVPTPLEYKSMVKIPDYPSNK
jgi:hypothetical protein